MLSPIWRWCLRRLFHKPAQPAKKRRQRANLEELESRLAPASYAVSAQLAISRLDAFGNGPTAARVVFCESTVAESQVLADGLDTTTDFVLLDGAGDGLGEMAAFLNGRRNLTSIGIVAHGATGLMSLGSLTLNAPSAARRAPELGALSAALGAGGEIDLWCCSLAAGTDGQALINVLYRATGAGIAAASHAVGAPADGGSWALDTRLGGARGDVPFTDAARADFRSVLAWSAAGNLAAARANQTATLLGNGKVLVTGGITSLSASTTDYLASAELYDPAANTWSAAGTMSTARYQQTATLLGSGKVLVAGGVDNNFNPLGSAELYDPSTNTWSAAASLATPRDQQTAMLLPSGEVLIVGGLGVDSNGMDLALGSTEIYDPAANTWSAGASLTTARYGHTATLLGNGKVLVAGGFDNSGNVLASAELYDPATNSWSAAGAMSVPRVLDAAALLGNGKVLVTGGASDANFVPLTSAELYNPATNSWSAAASMATARDQHTATVLSNGKVVVVGGADKNFNALASAETYDPGFNTWSAGATLASSRGDHSATLLQNGKLLVAGGFGPDILSFRASAEALDAPAPSAHFVVSNLTSTNVTAGGTVSFTITALDNSNQTLTGYTGTVLITSTDAASTFSGNVLPATYTFTAGDNGAHTFTVTLKTAGAQTVTVTDQSDSSVTATTSNITVTAGALTKFVVTVQGGNSVTAGNSFLLIGQASDAFGNPVTNYTGPTTATATATPGDPLVSFPIAGSVSSTGMAYFLGTLKTAGTYSLTVSAGGITGTSAPVTVNSAAASYFSISAPSSAITGNAMGVTVKALDSYGNVATGYQGHLRLTSTDAAATLPSDVTLTAGQATVNVTLITAGTQTITATDKNSTNPVLTGASGPIVTRGPTVTSFAATSTGFTVTFDKPFDPAKLTMYGPGATVQDAVLVGATVGTISGTLLFDPPYSSVIFKASAIPLNFLNTVVAGGASSVVLPDDSYTVTLLSGAANGFADTLGTGLDGAGNGGHANYTATFTTHYQNQGIPVLALPDFARGPDGSSAIKVPNNSGHGIPVTLYNSAAVTDATFTLTFNPALLAVTGASTGDSSAAGSTFTLSSSTPNTATFNFHTSTPQSGTVILGDILANVPNSAVSSYKVKELLQLGSINVNGAAFFGFTAPGVHVNAYFGDVSGDGVLGAADVNPMFNVAVGAATGFGAYSLLDPAIVGDVANDVSVDGGDVATLKSYILHFPRPVIPTPPGLSGIVIPNAADPTLSLVSSPLSVVSGQEAPLTSKAPLSVSVMLDHPHPEGSNGLTEAILALTYDPKALRISPSDITLGSIPKSGTGWQLNVTIDDLTGQIAIELYSATPITSNDPGTLVTIQFHPSPFALLPSSTSVRLVDSVRIGGQYYGTLLADDQGTLALTPGTDQVDFWTGGFSQSRPRRSRQRY